MTFIEFFKQFEDISLSDFSLLEEAYEENKRLTELLNRSNARLAEEQLINAELKTQIEKMKHCYNCKFSHKCDDEHCDYCEDYSQWELE